MQPEARRVRTSSMRPRLRSHLRPPVHPRRALVPGLALLLLGGGLALSPVPAAAAVTCTTVPGDVNGDGYAEVAVGEPGNNNGAGAVHVLYGGPAGVVTKATGSALDDQYFTQSTRGVPGVERADDQFGSATAFGDFDHDGCADLAVAANSEGTVTIFRGTPRGLSTTGVRRLTVSALAGVKATPKTNGVSGLEVADLDDDGTDDLAIASARTEVGTGTGALVVVFGDRDGLNQGLAGAELITRATPGVPGSPDNHEFAASLASGDFDGNELNELAVGGDGFVQILRVGPGRIGGAQKAPITPATKGFPSGGHSDWYEFGLWPMAGGDVNADGRDDLAVGNPAYQAIESEPGQGAGEGAVVLLYGSQRGLTTAGNQVWTQGSPGVDGSVSEENSFGYTVAMGRLDDGPTADLAVGAYRDSSGSVTVLMGSPDGLTTAGVGGTRFNRTTPGITSGSGGFGPTLAVSAVSSISRGSLVVGSPGADIGEADSAGSITVLGTAAGVPAAQGSRTLSASSAGVKGLAGPFEELGGALG